MFAFPPLSSRTACVEIKQLVLSSIPKCSHMTYSHFEGLKVVVGQVNVGANFPVQFALSFVLICFDAIWKHSWWCCCSLCVFTQVAVKKAQLWFVQLRSCLLKTSHSFLCFQINMLQLCPKNVTLFDMDDYMQVVEK
jgi:hypothetical protein